ncbi:fic family toxin-antitoxin system, toxin component [Streptomyces sp. NPDC087440]|uniref:fic family toxin-antitoxin system, toxin component n=1 Tax=Streptomyces sp. NPDC087440 TaxID=3365790 RepID=UPI003820775B
MLAVDLAWVLDVAQKAGVADPAPEDLGVAIGAVERHGAQLMGRPVYNGAFVRAAALAHGLSLNWLERSNVRVAATCAVRYLHEAGVPVRPDKEGVARLTAELLDPQRTAQSIADTLRSLPR